MEPVRETEITVDFRGQEMTLARDEHYAIVYGHRLMTCNGATILYEKMMDAFRLETKGE